MSSRVKKARARMMKCAGALSTLDREQKFTGSAENRRLLRSPIWDAYMRAYEEWVKAVRVEQGVIHEEGHGRVTERREVA